MSHNPHALHTRLGGAVGHVMDAMLTWSPQVWDGPKHEGDVALEERVRAHRAEDAAMAARIAAGPLTPPASCHCDCHGSDAS